MMAKDAAKKIFSIHNTVEKPADIIPALEGALASGKPSVLGVIIDASREHLEPPTKLRVKDRY